MLDSTTWLDTLLILSRLLSQCCSCLYLLYYSATCTGHGEATWNTAPHTVANQESPAIRADLLSRLRGDGIHLPTPLQQMSTIDTREHAFSSQGLAFTVTSTRTAALQLEGQAIADIAAAIPGLTTGDIYVMHPHHDDVMGDVNVYSHDHHCQCHCISW